MHRLLSVHVSQCKQNLFTLLLHEWVKSLKQLSSLADIIHLCGFGLQLNELENCLPVFSHFTLLSSTVDGMIHPSNSMGQFISTMGQSVLRLRIQCSSYFARCSPQGHQVRKENQEKEGSEESRAHPERRSNHPMMPLLRVSRTLLTWTILQMTWNKNKFKWITFRHSLHLSRSTWASRTTWAYGSFWPAWASGASQNRAPQSSPPSFS